MVTAKKTPAKKAPAEAPAPSGVHAVNTPTAHQVPKSQPVRVEIRIDGRIRFANLVYDPHFDSPPGQVSFAADLEPTWIDPAPVPAPTRFIDQLDPRDGEDFIPRVHSGRRDIVEPPEPEPATGLEETEQL